MNLRTPRGYKMSPYQMVHGCIRRSGYHNNSLSPAVMQVLLNENGLTAIEECAPDASEGDIILAIEAAQALPMGHHNDAIDSETDMPENDNSVDDAVSNNNEKESVGTEEAGRKGKQKTSGEADERSPKTKKREKAVSTGAAVKESWRKYLHPSTGRKQWSPALVSHQRDSEETKKKKEIHHRMLEAFHKR
jgi:hypothetical protein